MKYINITCPPLPHFIVAGSARYGELNAHPTRKAVGVYDLIYIKSGTLYIAEENDNYILTKDQYLILSPDTAHIGYKNSPPSTMFYWLHFYTHGLFNESEEQMSIKPLDTVIHVDSFKQECPFIITLPKHGQLNSIVANEVKGYLKTISSIHIDLHNERIWIDECKLDSLYQQNIFINLLNALKTSTHTSLGVDIPTLVINYIKSNFNRSFTLRQMARELNFHPNYITRVMKQKLSITPMDYLMNYRINYSKYLITHSYFSIKKIANESGFSSPAYFTKMFKTKTGMLPTEYRSKTNFKIKQ